MSSWKPSRSPSPPYRNRRYSPSRAVSPPPPPSSASRYVPPTGHRRDDDMSMARPMRSEHWTPPPHANSAQSVRHPPSAVYDRNRDERHHPFARRSRSPSPRYRDRRAPSPRRYRERSYSPPPRDRYRPSPPPLSHAPGSKRNRPGAADFYDNDDIPIQRDRYEARTGRGMAADWEEGRLREIPPPRYPRAEEQWESGADPREEDRYYDRDDEYYEGEWREGDASRRHGKGPSAPYRDVIFLGLDDELTESDFSGFLTSEHRANVTSVKIVRDKFTGKSKNFGFAQFASVQDAEDFVIPNYPYIQMPALYAHSEARRVKIDFSTPVGVPNPGAGPGPSTTELPPVHGIPPSLRHDGTRDIGTPGGGKRVLLLRMLDWNTRGDQIIRRLAQEITRMTGKQGREEDAEKAVVRVATIHDKVGRNASWGFTFVELVTAELAAALLSFLLSPQSQPNGFLIADRPVGASFANPAAFSPIAAGPLGGQYILRATRDGGIGSDTIDGPDSTWCTYAHEHGGAIEARPAGAPAIQDDGSIPPISAEVRSLLGSLAGKSAGSDSAATPSAPPSAGMVSISNVMQPIKIGTSISMPAKQTRKAEEAGLQTHDRKNLLGDDDEEEDLVGKDTVLLSRTKGAHIVPPTSGSRKIAKNISKWNTKQTELAAPEAPAPFAGGSQQPIGGAPRGMSSANATLGPVKQHQASRAVASASSSSSPPPTALVAPSGSTGLAKTRSPLGGFAGASTAEPTHAEDFDYSEPQPDGKVACLLCQRKLPSLDVLRKHVASSDLHKTNLANAETVAAGRRRKQQAVSRTTTSTSTSAEPETEQSQSKYRDRAAERREVFHQPEKPSYMDRMALAASSVPPNKRKFAEGPKAPSPPPEPGLAPGQDELNKGNALLTKMGWAAGTGLGKESEGRVDPIQVKQLQERAGLGAGKR